MRLAPILCVVPILFAAVLTSAPGAFAREGSRGLKLAVLDLGDKGVGADVAALLTVVVADELSEIGIFDVRLGSEEAAARAGKMRLEGKEYLVRDGDVVVVRFSK